ncbi:unnamed protein product [Diplocarpon coronariae]
MQSFQQKPEQDFTIKTPLYPTPTVTSHTHKNPSAPLDSQSRHPLEELQIQIHNGTKYSLPLPLPLTQAAAAAAPNPLSPAPKDTRPVVISGPSGVGKGTLYKLLLARHPSVFTTSISHTTRAPRPGEVRDVDYYYTSMEDFEAMIAAGGFVEHAKFGGNRYGTSKRMIEEVGRTGRVVVLDIEMEGVKQIQASSLSARYVFIAPPSFAALESRLRNRGTESEESIQKRLAQAHNEMAYSKTPGVHDIVIVNDDLERAYTQLEAFIFGEEGEGRTSSKPQEQSAKDGGKAGESVLD